MLFGKLLPREGNFFEMFNQHADRIVEAARAFSQLVANYNDPHLREQYNRDVDNAERAADRVTHDVNRMIHQTFITPIDRDQIHTLINTMDDVADLIQDSAETMALYDVRQVNEEIRRFAENSGLPELDVFCECERVDCLDRLSAQIDDYEAVRRFPTHFVVRPAHLGAEDRIIQETPEYVVIEKVGPDAAVAISQDPRRASIRRLT